MSRWIDAGISVYDRLVWPDGAAEQLLASGERRRELVAYFGEAEYAQLVPLAQRALQTPHDPQHAVWLVPGIMGSQLGVLRPAPQPPNLLWIDPVDFHSGALLEFGVDRDAGIQSLGVVLYTYLRLKLQLMAAGFTVRCFDYDWRLSVRDPATQLAAQIAASAAQRCSIVGHSMGGLVARAALQLLDDDKTTRARHVRVVTVATPHRGSFAAVQALRGSYATVRRIAQLDPLHSADMLVERAFRSFPSLYEMLPAGSADAEDSPDLLDPANWPSAGGRPDPRLLSAALEMRARLAAPDERVMAVIGVLQPTVTGLSTTGDEFSYRLSLDGDGTVPAEFASITGMPAWHAPFAHSELPRDARVAAGVIDLLRHGHTTQLAAHSERPRTVYQRVTDAQLHALHSTKLDWPSMTPEARHHFLDSLNEPPAFIKR